jgi:hypothetical protein
MTIANRKTNAEVAPPIINLILYSTCAYLNLTSRVDSNDNQCDEGKPSCKRCLKNHIQDKILLIRRALSMSIPHGPKDQRGTKKKNEQLGDRLEDS